MILKIIFGECGAKQQIRFNCLSVCPLAQLLGIL